MRDGQQARRLGTPLDGPQDRGFRKPISALISVGSPAPLWSTTPTVAPDVAVRVIWSKMAGNTAN